MTQTIPTRSRPDKGRQSDDTDAARYERFKAVIERFGSFDARPGALNLLGIRGYQDGRAVDNRPDEYNDTIAAVWRDANGRCRVREFRASVDPGEYYTDNPMRTDGVAHLVDGQYRYKRGQHKGRPALVQAQPVTVWRDRDRDHRQDAGETVETGWFGINIHDGGTGTKVGKWSAGCQVVYGGRSGADWQALMQLVDAHVGDTISYTLVDRAVLGLPLSEGASIPQPPGAETAAASRPMLRVGSSGTEVRELQRLLDDRGFSPGGIDGIFGRKTEAAVIRFQRAGHLQADGIVGPQTWSALLGAQKGFAAAVGEKRALLVAINDYGDPRNNLPSCIADAQAFRRQLDAYGFHADGIRVITDAEATVAAVEAGLDWLFDGIGPDDRAVFFYSGHGHQLPVDGVLTEVLVLRDGFYVDDVLADRTRDLPDGVFTAVLDSCFSGGMDKIVFGNVDGTADFAQSKRWTVTAAKKGQTGTDAPTEVVGYRRFGAAKGAPGEADDTPLKGLMLAACSENETASASNSRTRGLSAFTFALLGAIEEHGKDASASVLMGSVRGTLKSHGFRQTPTLYESPGPFRLAERSFVELRDRGARSARRSAPRDQDVWSRLVAQLLNLTTEKDMTYDVMDDETAEKALPLLATLAPILIQSAVSALQRRGRKKEFAAAADEPDFSGLFANADNGEDQDEGTAKFLGALGSLVSTLAPSVAEQVLPVAMQSLSSLLGGKTRPRGGPRRKDYVAPDDADPEVQAKAFRLALQMVAPLLRANVRVRAG